jgi:signal transduction histidine kinase
MKCVQFTFDFAPKNNHKLNELYDDTNLYAFFTIPKSEKFNIKISYPKQNYVNDMKTIRQTLWVKFILATLLLFGIALFFTFYSLRPIRKALKLNDEFIKDILHDFNTPITSMVLNMKMFKEEKGEDPYIQRVSHSVDTILLLQNNLKSFLYHSPSQNAKVDIASLAKKRLDAMQNIYPKLTFTFIKHNNLKRVTNDELLTRILDNLLSNAAKYNRSKGKIELSIQNDTLCIKDTGKGIKDIDKVLQRYYKEQDRGLGLGLHIVQKLTNELNIEMKINSMVDIGTEFILDFSFLEKEET